VPGLTISAAYLKAELETGGAGAEVDFRRIAATDATADAFIEFGGISQASIDILAADFDSMGLGVGFDLAGLAGVSSTVSLELARTEQSTGAFSSDLDTLRLGVSFQLRKKGPMLGWRIRS
jgi:hypothetical protein